MESALIISALPAKGEDEPAAKSVSAKEVFPHAVGAQITTTVLRFDSVFNLFGKKLAGGKRYHFAVVFFDYGIFYHRKLIRAAAGGTRYFVYVIRKLYQFF